MFRQVLVPGQCLFTTDDNIGQMQMIKNLLSIWADGYYSDTTFLGMPGGAVSVWSWSGLMVWMLPFTFFFNWMHAINLVLGSLFLAMWLRSRNVGWPSIALGLLTAFWVGSNLTLTYAGHRGKFGLLMVACVALYCISRALSRKASILWGILTGGVLAFMLMEQLDVALFYGFALGAYALFLAIRQWRANGIQPSQPRALLRRSRPWAKSAVAIVLMVGIPLLITSTMMFVSYAANIKGAASIQTESPQEKWAFVTQWSWPPEECIDFIAPGYMGWRSGEPEGPYWGRMGRSAGWEQTRQGFMNFKLENQYLGIIPTLLALFAIWAGVMGGRSNGVPECGSKGVNGGKNNEMRSYTDTLIHPYSDTPMRPYSTTLRRSEIIFWGCVAVVTLLLAFGKFFPLYALFYKLPLVSSIRNPNKFLQVFQLVLGILAAYGLDEVLQSKHRTSNIERSASNK